MAWFFQIQSTFQNGRGGAVKLRMTHRQLSGGVLSITEAARSNDNLLYPWTDLLSSTVRGRCFTWQPSWHVGANIGCLSRCILINLFRIAKIRTSLTTAACKTRSLPRHIAAIDYGNVFLYGISDRLLHRLAREVPRWIQTTRHCVSRSTRSNVGVRRLANHAVRAASRLIIINFYAYYYNYIYLFILPSLFNCTFSSSVSVQYWFRYTYTHVLFVIWYSV